MKRIIEVEEIVKVHHQIYVEYGDEEQLDDALNDDVIKINNLDDFIDNLGDYGIKVCEINENYSEETDSIEYYDDYKED